MSTNPKKRKRTTPLTAEEEHIVHTKLGWTWEQSGVTARQWNEFNHDIKAIVTYANGGKLDAASSSLFTEAHVVIDALLQSCMTLRHKAKDLICEYLKTPENQISIILDGWSIPRPYMNQEYLGLFVRCGDNIYALDLFQILIEDGSILSWLTAMLDEFDIKLERVAAVVTDRNVPSITKGLTANGHDVLHMACSKYGVENIMYKAFNELLKCSGTWKRIWDEVTDFLALFAQSVVLPDKLAELNNGVKPTFPPFYPRRFSTWYHSLDTFYKSRTLLSGNKVELMLTREDPDKEYRTTLREALPNLSEDDWDTIHKVLLQLKPLADVCHDFESNSSNITDIMSTVNLASALFWLFSDQCNADHPILLERLQFQAFDYLTKWSTPQILTLVLSKIFPAFSEVTYAKDWHASIIDLLAKYKETTIQFLSKIPGAPLHHRNSPFSNRFGTPGQAAFAHTVEEELKLAREALSDPALPENALPTSTPDLPRVSYVLKKLRYIPSTSCDSDRYFTRLRMIRTQMVCGFTPKAARAKWMAKMNRELVSQSPYKEFQEIEEPGDIYAPLGSTYIPTEDEIAPWCMEILNEGLFPLYMLAEC